MVIKQSTWLWISYCDHKYLSATTNSSMIPYWAHAMTPGLALSCHWASTETSGPNCINWQGRRTSALLLCMLKRSPMVLRPEPSVVILQRVYCDPTATSSSSLGPSWALGDPTGLSYAIWWPLGRIRSPGWSQPRCDRGISAWHDLSHLEKLWSRH